MTSVADQSSTESVEQQIAPDWFTRFRETGFGQVLGSGLFANLITASALIFATVSLSSTNALQRDLVREQSVLQRQIAANEVWTSYIEWSFENPQFPNSVFEVDSDKNPKNEKHAWFMERLLSAAEEIFNAYPRDIQWEDTFVYEFQLHESYFVSDYFLGSNSLNSIETMSFYCSYDPPVRKAIQRAFASKPVHEEKMKRANDDCVRILTARGHPNA